MGSVRLSVTLVARGPAAASQRGFRAGETVEVAIELDTAPREVEVPAALAAALAADPAANAAFEGLAFSHRKEYARWIGEAKREETRDRRGASAPDAARRQDVELSVDGVP